MAAKYHIKDDGMPGKCSAASSESCPKTQAGDGFHGTLEEASAESQKRFEDKLGAVVTATKSEQQKDEAAESFGESYSAHVLKLTDDPTNPELLAEHRAFQDYIGSEIRSGRGYILSKTYEQAELYLGAARERDAENLANRHAESVQRLANDPADKEALAELNAIQSEVEVRGKVFESAFKKFSGNPKNRKANEAKAAKPAKKDSGAKEVYVHPQGKIIVVENNIATAYKDGKVVSSSASVEKLRAGYGSWKRDESGSAAPADSVAATAKAATPRAKKSKLPPATTQEEISRRIALKKTGYPETSGLDPTKKPKGSDGAPSKAGPYPQSYFDRSASSVLPTDTRVNPHANPESNEYVQVWGDNSNYMVYKQTTYDGKEYYRTVVTSGEANPIGDETYFFHDQSLKRMGHEPWKVVGAFEAKPGGAAVGEIPNRNMPLYTFK